MSRIEDCFLAAHVLAVPSLARPAQRNRIVAGDLDYRTRAGFDFGALGIALILIALDAVWC